MYYLSNAGFTLFSLWSDNPQLSLSSFSQYYEYVVQSYGLTYFNHFY
jgi:hypothetical protein